MYSGEFFSGRVTYEIGGNLLMDQGKGRRHEAAPKGIGGVIHVVTNCFLRRVVSDFLGTGKRVLLC